MDPLLKREIEDIYTLCGRHTDYESPAMSRCSGDHVHAAARVPVGSATGNDDRGGMGVVPESPACDDIIEHTNPEEGLTEGRNVGK